MSFGINLAKSFKLRVTTKLRNAIDVIFSEKYLFYTNVTISITLSGVGDVLEQHYEMVTDRVKHWNGTRTVHMAASGMTIGIICHHWYRFLDRKLPGYALRTIVNKIVIDQVVCSPLCISAFFLTLGFLEGTSTDELAAEVRHKAWRLYAAEWIVWPPAQFINFYFLPTKFRVLYDNTISLGYDVYTSYVKHNFPINDDS